MAATLGGAVCRISTRLQRFCAEIVHGSAPAPRRFDASAAQIRHETVLSRHAIRRLASPPCSPASPPSPSTASPPGGSPSRSTCAPACRPSRSSGSATRPCASRASACARRCSTRASSSRSGASPSNLAPAHLRKAGPGFDLAIACGVLAACGQVPGDALERWAVFGELVARRRAAPLPRRARGRRGRARAGHRGARSSRASARARRRSSTASTSPGVDVPAARSPRSCAAGRAGRADPPAAGDAVREPTREPDLADVRGHARRVRALTIAAAGGHNLLLSGPARHRQDDARAPAAVDPAAADARRGARGDADPQRRRRAVGGGLVTRAAVPRAAPHDLAVGPGRRRLDARARARPASPTTASCSSTSCRSSRARARGAAPAARGRRASRSCAASAR